MPTLSFNANWPSGSAGTGTVPENMHFDDMHWPYWSLDMPGNTGNLAKAGYQWLGWARSSSATTPDYVGGEHWYMSWDFFEADIDVELFAVWKAAGLIVTYNGNGSTSGSAPTDNNSYQSGATVTVLGNTGNLVRTGFRFLGWNTNSSATTAQYVAGNTFNIAANTTLYAIWKQTFTVTYNGNGSTSGTVPTDNNSPYDTGATVTVLGNTGNLAKPNHIFLGWSTNNSATTPQYTQGQTFTITQNTTLYAIWQATPTLYTITYNGNSNTGGSAPIDSNNPYNSGSTVTVLGQGTLTKTNYVFLGWSTNSSAASAQYAQGSTFIITQNTTLYAIWQAIPPPQTHTVNYNGNGNTGGSAPIDPNSPYTNGSTVTVLGNTNGLTRPGYTFQGWHVNHPTASTIRQPGYTFTATESITFHANWVKTPYIITYSGNGSTGGIVPEDNGQYYQGDPVTVKANTGSLVRVGYTFLGWAFSSSAVNPDFIVNGNTVIPSTFNMGTSNVILYAVWSDNNSSGGGGGSFDGGVINNSLVIKCKFPALFETWTDVANWMNTPQGSLPDYSAYLRFVNINTPPVLSTDIYGIAFKDGNSNVAGVGINDSLLVRKSLFAKSGGIGTLSVPSRLEVDNIENFDNTKDLIIKANSGKNIKLDGNVQITGSLIGSGQGGGTFNGGEVYKPITIKNTLLRLYNFQTDADLQNDKDWNLSVRDWLYGGDNLYNADGTFKDTTERPPGAKKGVNNGLRLADNNEDIWNNLTNIALHGMNINEPSQALGVSKHLFIRGDFLVRGPLKSREGIIVLHGNGINEKNMQPATPGDFTTGWNIGWGPRVGTPFIFLAEGGDYANSQGGNPDASTLLIVTNRVPPPPPNDLLPLPNLKDKYYKWGHLECGNLTVHGTANLVGGTNSVKAGQTTTDSDGTKTVVFPPGTFTSTPIITVTVVDASSNSQAYTAKIVSATKDGFKVKILTSRHKHLLGNTGNRITSNLYKIPGITPSDAAASIYEYPLAFYNNIENNTVVGAVITNSTGPSTGQDFYSLTENGANTVGSGIVFNWIAAIQTH